jgi:hypothetical protein
VSVGNGEFTGNFQPSLTCCRGCKSYRQALSIFQEGKDGTDHHFVIPRNPRFGGLCLARLQLQPSYWTDMISALVPAPARWVGTRSEPAVPKAEAGTCNPGSMEAAFIESPPEPALSCMWTLDVHGDPACGAGKFQAREQRAGRALWSLGNGLAIEHLPDRAVSGGGRVPLMVEEVCIRVGAGRYLLRAKRAVGARHCRVR